MTLTSLFDEAGKIYQQTRMAHWDKIAIKRDTWQGMGKWYHQRLTEIYKFLVSPNQRILEIGCGFGNLLTELRPTYGIGIDFSSETITRAKQKNPNFEYHQLDVHDLSKLNGEFDVIILSDTINDLWDVQRALEQIKKHCAPHTRIILNFYSHLWQFPLRLAQTLNLASPMLNQNWLTPEDVNNLLRLAGFETIRTSQEVLFPLPLGSLANRYLVKIFPFYHFALSNFVIARPLPTPSNQPSVSVIVAARNEAGNIKNIFERLPKMGNKT